MNSFSRVVKPPQSHTRLLCGFEQLAHLLALTLGPMQGTVVCGGASGPTEFLIDSGVIARRVVALQDRAEDTGAMLLRSMAWRMHEDYGDGAATAAVLALAMAREAMRMAAAGMNPMLLRRGIEQAAAVAARALDQQAIPASGQETLTRLAEQVSGYAQLSRILGEIFDLAGANTALEIEEYAAPYLEHQYLDGGRWRARPAARLLMPADKAELILENPVVLVVNQKLERVEQVRAILEAVAGPLEKRPLLLVAPGISGDALTTLTINHTRGALTVAAAIVTSSGAQLRDDLYDAAALTGSTVLAAEVGSPPERAAPAHFGQARRVVLARDLLTIIGGGGAAGRQNRISELRSRLTQHAPGSEERERLQKQIARLTGGVGILKVGAYSTRERDQIKETARKAARVLETALVDGVVPGGGVAYLDCSTAVQAAIKSSRSGEDAAGMKVVARALEAPFCQLVQNSGHLSPMAALADVRRKGAGHGFDVRAGKIVSMAEAGILDSLAVLRGALLAAASAAVMAITTDVLVLRPDHRRPPQAAP